MKYKNIKNDVHPNIQQDINEELTDSDDENNGIFNLF
jgi:hypothetical protein